MGDWLLTDAKGAVHLLDVVEGTLRPVASDVEELCVVAASPAWRDEIFLEGLATSFLRADGKLPAGRCVGFRVPPVLGGATEATNLEVVPVGVYQRWCGRLHRALSRVPVGRRVTGVHVDEDGEVSVRWE